MRILLQVKILGIFLTFWNNTDSNPASFVLPGCFYP